MNVLDNLNLDKSNLLIIDLEMTEELARLKSELDLSFTNSELNTNKLSDEFLQLQTKHESLSRAIESNDLSIQREQESQVLDSKAKDLATRKRFLKKSLESLTTASKLQSELEKELKNVMKYNNLAQFRNNSEIHQSVRGLVGKLAAEFNLHGALQLAATIPVPTIDDYDRLTTNIHEY
jgi:hypothetical protein|tara:strand:+ start:273 stop:809 length:537 start_codon:yes stop_codon:yes gene_type:complete